jgi:uncharacterized protein YbgA (DUF1722 family)/uncharacterized protein YbbK (DUF523 family)
MTEAASSKPLVGISSCLLGQQVRFDGGHKKDGWITGPLGAFFDFLPVCPEVGIGLGVPRPTIHLVGDPARPRALGSRDASLDVTARLEAFGIAQLPRLEGLSGYILKSKSPSCGMARVPVTSEKGMPAKVGVGIYARVLLERMPLLPVEEEGRLNDPVLRENFVTRVYVLHRWQQLRVERMTAAKLIDFHSRQKYLVMAHSQAAYQRLGQMLSHLKQVDLEAVADMYVAELMAALARRVTRKRHVNVLHHIMGYFTDHIDAGDKAELLASIEAYRREEVALVVPITLLRHHLRRHPDPYMEKQVYLVPHPEKLALRGAI